MNERSAVILAVIVAVGLVPVSQFGSAGVSSAPSVEVTAAPGPNASAATTTHSDTTTPRDTTTGAANAEQSRPTAAEIRANAIEASRNVRTYRVIAIVNRTVSSARINRTANVTSRGVFDRPARELRINQTTRSRTRTVAVTTYVVDGTLYMKSDTFVRQYSSKWVKTRLSAADERRWTLLDTLARQRAILANASVEYLRTSRVNGTRAYVLRADVNESAYLNATPTRIATEGVNVTNASFQFWIAADSGRILQSRGTVESTVTLRGRSVNVTQRLSLQFHAYNSTVSITLPDAAGTAVTLGNRTTTEGEPSDEETTTGAETTTEADTTTDDGSASRARPDGRQR